MRLLPFRVLLVGGPVALAFFAGGFGDRPREVALAVAVVGLAGLLVLAPRPLLPRGTGPRLALAGFVGLAAWVLLSRSWAPAADAAGDDAERLCLYAFVLAAATLGWRERAAARWAEVGVAAGALVVIGYGLAGRLVPGLVPQDASVVPAGGSSSH